MCSVLLAMRAMHAKMMNKKSEIETSQKQSSRLIKRNRTRLSGGFWAHYRVFST
jgi:hypothetical protein